MERKVWKDFAVGEQIKTWSITVTETHIVNFAHLTMDFYPLHMDEEYAKTTAFKTRIAHGPLIFSLAIGLVGASGFLGNAVIAWLGIENMKIYLPTKPGDTIVVEAKVIEKRATKNPERGIVVFEYNVLNQIDKVVMSFHSLLMLQR